MKPIDPKIIWELDYQYAKAGIPFHARPMRAAFDFGRSEFSITPSFPNSKDSWEQAIMNAYRQLIPEVDTTWPGTGIGIAASVDQVKKLVLPVTHGECAITFLDALEFRDQNKWLLWCRADEKIAAGSQYAFIDIADFTYGMESIASESSSQEIALWRQAASNLAVIADSLANCYRTNSILQPICMAAELAMKGALIRLGVAPIDLQKKFGHNHIKLAQELIKISPHHEDDHLFEAVRSLPDYVQSRYDETKVTRLEIVRLALRSQFIAASSLRKVSKVDETVEMAASQWPGPRAA